MKYLTGFNQAKLLGNLSNSVNYGCCLAFSIEWVRLALYQYSSPLATGAETRAAVLARQAQTIATCQSVCNEYTTQYGKPPVSTENPTPTAIKPHQDRQCYILNSIGNQTQTLKKIDAALRATNASFAAPRFKMTNPGEWSNFGQEIMTPDTFHILLLKRKDTAAKWHHAIASWAYLENGNEVAHLFDPNYGEVKIEAAELAGEVLKVVDRCETGATLHSLRYIRVEKGHGPTGGVDF
jgi:hypothetical protein